MGVFLEGCERARERVFWKCIFVNHTVQRARKTHGLEARKARREAARVPNSESGFVIGASVYFMNHTVSLRVRAIGGTILLVDFDQGRLCEDMRAGVSAGRADAGAAAAVNLSLPSLTSQLPIQSEYARQSW